jgi:hypothetical protein
MVEELKAQLKTKYSYHFTRKWCLHWTYAFEKIEAHGYLSHQTDSDLSGGKTHFTICFIPGNS